MTTVSFQGKDVYIDGVPTYRGRFHQGHRVEGLLFNVRAVQALFDDTNPNTVQHWAYPDTGTWDAQRNVDEFCAALPIWKAHGVLAVTVNLQGGGPTYTPDVYHDYTNSAFGKDGSLDAAYVARLLQVIDAADRLGLVVIVGLYYWTQLLKMDGEAAMWCGARLAGDLLAGCGYRNILVEVVNEVDVVVKQTPYAMFTWEEIDKVILDLKERHPDLLISTSPAGAKPTTGESMPTPNVVAASDYVLLHGNGCRPPQIADAIKYVRAMPAYQRNPKPIIFNEDSPAIANMEAAWTHGTSWGYYDQGWAGQGPDPYEPYAPRPRGNAGPLESLTGYQTPPVNWGINTPFKRVFFERVAEITGAPGASADA